jgi:hypothetical protein
MFRLQMIKKVSIEAASPPATVAHLVLVTLCSVRRGSQSSFCAALPSAPKINISGDTPETLEWLLTAVLKQRP